MEGLPSEPVEEGGSGEGRPYAPEDWPRAGDRWRWRAGRRTTGEGFFRDRVLLPPRRYRGSSALGRKGVLKSRLQVEQFVKLEMPEADLQEFWRLFIWRIPAASGQVRKQGSEKKTTLSACAKPSQANGHIGPVTSPFCGNCKVGNKMCHIRVQALKDPFPCMPCDICCTEAGFCRDCCCILCDHTIDSGDGGYNFLRCKAVVENEDEKFICGHNAHVRCALRAYLAGTVGGNVALDAEYYCRRCDSRTDLVSYLTEVLNSSKSIDCKDDIEKILNLASCLLRGAQRINAKELHIRVEKMLAKLRDGFNLKEIWNTEDGIQALAAANDGMDEMVLLGTENGICYFKAFETFNNSKPSEQCIASAEIHEPTFTSLHSKSTILEFENAIDNALQELKKSQELEYKLAKEKLDEQKDYILGLYQEFEAGRSGLTNTANHPSKTGCDPQTDGYLSSMSKIKHEEEKLNVMMHISNGFGRTPKDILRGLYGMQVDG